MRPCQEWLDGRWVRRSTGEDAAATIDGTVSCEDADGAKESQDATEDETMEDSSQQERVWPMFLLKGVVIA